jgi:hypothetical protein
VSERFVTLPSGDNCIFEDFFNGGLVFPKMFGDKFKKRRGVLFIKSVEPAAFTYGFGEPTWVFHNI